MTANPRKTIDTPVAENDFVDDAFVEAITAVAEEMEEQSEEVDDDDL